MNRNEPVTVRDLVTLLWRWQGRLVAGESGLGRAVTGASVMRARLPAFEGFQEGDLALLSLGALRALQSQAPSFTPAAIVEQLASIGASAIAIAGLLSAEDTDAPGAASQHTPLDPSDVALARTLADAIQTPLIALPLRTPLLEVERAVIAHVLERRERAVDTPPELADAYAASLRASLRAEALAALLAGTYVSETQMRARAVQLGYDLGRPHAALWVELTLGPAPATAETAQLPVGGRPVRRTTTAISQTPTHAAAMAMSPGAQLADALTVALGAWALARPSSGEASEAFAGRQWSERSYGYGASTNRQDGQVEEVIALLPLEGVPSQQGEREAGNADISLDGAQATMNVAIGTGVGEVREVGEVGEMAALAERARTLLTRTLGQATRHNNDANGKADATSAPVMWSAGLAEPATTPTGVRHSATEARDAARLGRMLLGPGAIARPADLGVYRLLLALHEHDELAPFVERTLAPLQPKTRSGEELIETLDVFFASNGNLSEAARRLHLHRNSLLYRLGRARELLGHDLDDADLRFSLQLAIKARSVLRLLLQ